VIFFIKIYAIHCGILLHVIESIKVVVIYKDIYIWKKESTLLTINDNYRLFN